MEAKTAVLLDSNNNTLSCDETDFATSESQTLISIRDNHHSKFCFSRDISEKEDSLLRCSISESSKGKSNRKYVTFDRSSPVLIGHDGDKIVDSDLESTKQPVHEFDITDSDSMSQSETDFFDKDVLDTLSAQETILRTAEDRLADIATKLQNLWLDCNESDNANVKCPPATEKRNLLQTVGLISFITEQLTTHRWQSTSSYPAGQKRTRNSHNSNLEILEEELANAKNKIKCLEAENSYFSKENSLLNAEVRELAYKMAANGYGKRKGCLEHPDVSPEAEVFYKNPRPNFDHTESKYESLEESRNIGSIPNHVESHNQDLVLKRENEMDSLLNDFHKMFRTHNQVQTQVQMCNDQLENWRRMLQTTNEEKNEMFQDLVKIINEHKAVLKERDNYEFILKIIIQEKYNDNFDVKSLLENLIFKLSNCTGEDESSWIQTSILEGTVQSLQQQTHMQHDEICRLRQILSEAHMQIQVQENELNSCSVKIAAYLDELNSCDARMKIAQEECQQKYDKLQEQFNEAVTSKSGVEKTLSDKNEEIKEMKEVMKVMKKTSKQQNKKFLELQKTNLMLVRDAKDSKENMDRLAEIISQLRTSMKEQKSQWEERLQQCNEEIAQNKQHCEWLKHQIEQLGDQLKEAHDRLKGHEQDKVQLAHQLLLAEEERRVVDRKLHELRTTLQGDTGLREALLERNEALQLEINRLRLAKANCSNFELMKFAPPPMESSMSDKILFPHSEIHHPITEKAFRKNCFTTASRRASEGPRVAVSLHSNGTA